MAFASSVERFEEVSTLTDKGQTTVPNRCARRWGLTAGTRIASTSASGVSLRRADDSGDPRSDHPGVSRPGCRTPPENLKAFPPE